MSGPGRAGGPAGPGPGSWGKDLTLAAPPAGIQLWRDETSVRLISALQGRLRLALTLAGLAALGLADVVACCLAHPAGHVALALWWLMLLVGAGTSASCLPLALLAVRLRRLVVLTPGVLLVREGRRPLGAECTCLRAAIQRVRLVGHGPKSERRLEIEAEISPTSLRLLAGEAPSCDAGEVVVAVMPLCRAEPVEIAEYLGSVIARWASRELEIELESQRGEHVGGF